MAAPSRPPTFKQYGVKPSCNGCGRRLRADENLWFQAHPVPAVWGFSCCAINNRK
jgi:hypothetical protein